MLKGSVFIATSVDGFIARRNGAIDWLPETTEDHGYHAFVATVDALVMGRNTYETVLGFGGAWPFTKPVFVLSSKPIVRLPDTDGAAIEVMGGEPMDIAAALTARGIGHVYVDGGITIQRFLRAGLIQKMTITRIPCLLGDGIPLFGSLPNDVRLRHETTTTYPSGLVSSTYHIDA